MDATVLITVALALAAGVVAGILSHHLRIPNIVLLLIAGVILGPDRLGWIRPEGVAGAVHLLLVAFAVAIILFEGGLNLDMRRLRREGRAIGQLVTVGALVTAAGAALVVTLQLLEATTPLGAASGIGSLFVRLGTGAGAGLIGGWLLAAILARGRLIPEGHANIFVLGSLLMLYVASDLVVADSGILPVTVAGIAVGNRRTPVSRDLLEFKEPLTVLLIGFLFTLLAAQVRLESLNDLGWPGLLVVTLLMFVVRPLNVAAGTAGVRLTWRQRAFLAWIAPRGIVAAAVASLFAERLAERGVTQAAALQSLVFLTIAVTLTAQGITAGWLAAQKEALRVVCGHIHAERVPIQSELGEAAIAMGVTGNGELNLLFLRQAREAFRVPLLYAALESPESSSALEDLRRRGDRILFGRHVDVECWDVFVRRKAAARLRTSLSEDVQVPPVEEWELPDALLPVVIVRDGKATPVDLSTQPRASDLVLSIYNTVQAREVMDWLDGCGWRRIAGEWALPDGETGDTVPASPARTPLPAS